MASRDATRHYTYDDYLRFPDDGRRYQIIDGELFVTPAPVPKHQLVAGAIHALLWAFLRGTDLGTAFISPIDLHLADDTVVQPDVCFVSKARGRLIGPKSLVAGPDLVVEVLSPSTRRIDLERKRALYARVGVPEYWIVDPTAERIEVLLLRGGEYTSAEVFTSGEVRSLVAIPDFAFAFSDVFPSDPASG